MLRVIWRQIVNRKKSNSWLLLELLFVFCLVWYMVDYFFVLGYNHSIPSYRDIQNTYYVNIGTLSTDHNEYNITESEPEAAIANFYRIVNRIKEHSDVESVGLCIGEYSLPGGGSFHGGGFRNIEDTSRTVGIQRISIILEEDYLKVFRHTTDKGKKEISISDYDWGNPNTILVSKMIEDRLFPGESAVGKTIESPNGHPQYQIIGVVDDLKRFSYTRPYSVVFIPDRLNDSNYQYVKIAIRTNKSIPDTRFITEFKKQMSSSLRIGNYYLKDVSSLTRIEEDTDYLFGQTITVRTNTGLMIFFLISIIFCVFGTFWYRINTRREEIGIRRAMGSTAMEIKWLFIKEGIVLLSIIVLPAMLIEIQFVYAGFIETLGVSETYGNYLPDRTIIRFVITNVITWIILAGVMVLSIWYPAYSASRIKPIEALKDE